MKQLSMYISDLNYGKYANSLKNMKVLASSDTYMIVVLKSDLEVKNVNNIQNEEGYEKFTNVILGKPKKIFAMDFNQYNQTMDTFRRLSATKSLPEPAIVHVNYDENHTVCLSRGRRNLLKSHLGQRMKPFLQQKEADFSFRFVSVVADAGYESQERRLEGSDELKMAYGSIGSHLGKPREVVTRMF